MFWIGRVDPIWVTDKIGQKLVEPKKKTSLIYIPVMQISK